MTPPIEPINYTISEIPVDTEGGENVSLTWHRSPKTGLFTLLNVRVDMSVCLGLTGSGKSYCIARTPGAGIAVPFMNYSTDERLSIKLGPEKLSLNCYCERSDYIRKHGYDPEKEQPPREVEE